MFEQFRLLRLTVLEQPLFASATGFLLSEANLFGDHICERLEDWPDKRPQPSHPGRNWHGSRRGQRAQRFDRLDHARRRRDLNTSRSNEFAHEPGAAQRIGIATIENARQITSVIL